MENELKTISEVTTELLSQTSSDLEVEQVLIRIAQAIASGWNNAYVTKPKDFEVSEVIAEQIEETIQYSR